MLETDPVEKWSAGNRALYSVHFKEILQQDVGNPDINGILWVVVGNKDSFKGRLHNRS